MKILLPFDGSLAALEAVGQVIRMADEGLDVHVVLANVQEPANLYELMVAHDPAVIEHVSNQAAAHILETAQERLVTAGLPVVSETASGDPAHTLLDLIDDHDVDLVVMGSRGMSSVRRAMLGSVSHELLHAARVPVMIVKAGDELDTIGGE